MSQFGVAALYAGAATSIRAVTEQASSGASDIQQLLLQVGGVGGALTVGWLMIKRSDSRESAALARADALLHDERATHQQTTAQLTDERARRIAAEAHIELLTQTIRDMKGTP